MKKTLLLFTLFCFLLSAIGCDAFVRKFTRKKKVEESAQVEMVLAPEEYKAPQLSKEDEYRQYYMFWKSWADELDEALLHRKSQKKQLDCANQALKNLTGLRTLLMPQKQQELDVYIKQATELRERIKEDLYGNNISLYRQNSERIRRDIIQYFAFPKIKQYLQ